MHTINNFDLYSLKNKSNKFTSWWTFDRLPIHRFGNTQLRYCRTLIWGWGGTRSSWNNIFSGTCGFLDSVISFPKLHQQYFGAVPNKYCYSNCHQPMICHATIPVQGCILFFFTVQIISESLTMDNEVSFRLESFEFPSNSKHNFKLVSRLSSRKCFFLF